MAAFESALASDVMCYNARCLRRRQQLKQKQNEWLRQILCNDSAGSHVKNTLSALLLQEAAAAKKAAEAALSGCGAAFWCRCDISDLQRFLSISGIGGSES